jgi:hypothetical protein
MNAFGTSRRAFEALMSGATMHGAYGTRANAMRLGL